MELSAGIREIAGNGWTAVVIGPESYNRLYAKFGNLNRLLAWGHARVIENLLEKVPACPRMLSDKFADERLIRRALLTRGREIRLDQRTKAESDVAVEAEFGIELPRGAGPQVKAAGRSLMERFGASVFERCAKTHFKTWNELTGTPVEGGESW